MYLRKYRDGWRVEVQRNGVRLSHAAPTKREAQDWGAKKEAELGLSKGTGRKTLESAVTHYLATVSSHKKSPEWEARRLAAMLEHFGPLTAIGSIDSAAIGRWRDERLETVSGSTVQREANLLRHLFTLAVDEWRWLDRNPFKGVRLPKESEPRHQVWKWQQIRRVLRHPCSGKTAEVVHAFHVALHTGLRLQEIITGKYDPARRVVDLERTKTGGRVSVPVARRAVKVLPWEGSVDANEASVLFSKLTRSLLIEGLTFHDSRASALTWLSRRMDVMTLARISRHRDLRTLLNTYYRESAEQIAARI
jgi:hypothetical protein